MTIEEFAREAVKKPVPFRPHGRSWEGWDCWGLICVAYQEVKGITLPQYNRDYCSIKDRELLQKLFAQGIEDSWEEIKEPEPCAGIMYFAWGRTCHVGLAVNNEMMLHTEHGSGTSYESINNFRRIEGIYRYVEK